MVWKIRDGRNTNFWLDKWCRNNVSLTYVRKQTYVDTTLSVRDVLTSSRDWDIVFHMNHLSADIVSQIIVLLPSMDDNGPITIGW